MAELTGAGIELDGTPIAEEVVISIAGTELDGTPIAEDVVSTDGAELDGTPIAEDVVSSDGTLVLGTPRAVDEALAMEDATDAEWDEIIAVAIDEASVTGQTVVVSSTTSVITIWLVD